MNTAGQSWNRHLTFEVDRISPQSLAVGNGSLPTGASHGEETRPYNAFVRQLLQLFQQVFYSERHQSIRCPCYGCST
nr:hypothetical protein [Tanacetum cinerariifolium]